MKACLQILLCISLLSFAALMAAAQYRFDSWTTDNGLPQNGLRGIAQTPDGYLWLTTLDGLVRFDGVEFAVFDKNNSKGIINNRFWAIYATPNGDVWAATAEGEVTVYHNGIFTSYSADQIPESQITGFEADANGEILVNTGANLYTLRDGKFVFVRTNAFEQVTRSTYFGKNDAVWKISANETTRTKDGQTQAYPVSLDYINAFGGNLFEDKNGGMWIAEVGKLFNLNNGKINSYGIKDGVPPKTVAHDFWDESDGSIWFATGDFSTAGVGLVRFKDGKFDRFGMESGLSNDRIFRVFKDREGTVWLTTNKGLNRLRRQIITSFSKADGLIDNEIYPILRTRDGSIYIGAVGGLSRFKDGKVTPIHLPFPPDPVISIQSLWEDARGRLWVGAVGSLFVIENGKARKMDHDFKAQETVSAIYSDKKGDVWFGTEKSGVFRYHDRKMIQTFTTEKGLPSNEIKVIHEAADGTFWFGTYGGIGIAECGDCPVKKTYTIADGLASNFVRSIKEDADGTFWIGTYDGGLSRFKDGKFFNFTTENGLFSNGVFAIVEDGKGNFWMSSNKGIFRAGKHQLSDFADGKATRYDAIGYGKQDGMLNTECNGGRQPSAMTDSDGRIWFPTLEGVAIVNPENLTTNPLPPPVQIETVEIDRKSTDPRESIRIAPNQTYLDIRYTALSFIKSDQIRFKHRLEGVDKDWVDDGTRRTVNYSFLPPSEYTFTVIAANSDGVWNEVGRSIAITVEAPFYRTTWFFLLAIGLAIGVGLFIYRYRVGELNRRNLAQETFARQLIESQESERKRIAQEIHDGLGQSLLIIKNRASMGRSAELREKADEQFDEIGESVTDALAEVRVIARNLRPLHLERLGMTATLEEMVEQLDEASDIEINYDIENIDGLLSPADEMNLYRIVQECLNNVIKHSRASKAGVTVSLDGQNIVVTVRDNGQGFDREASQTSHGLGLNGVAERARILGGSYAIETDLGSGTTVSVQFPIDM